MKEVAEAYLGFEVLSANTDGITVLVKKARYDEFKKVVSEWEKLCNLTTEEVKYKSIHNQSVNSYIAIKEDGSFKTKGSFNSFDLSRNPAIKVCKDAIISYLTKQTPIEESILNCPIDPINFIEVRTVTTGGYWKGNYLGKVVRWYWSLDGEAIRNPKGHKVSKTDNAYPIMNLKDELKNIHYEKYIKHIGKEVCIVCNNEVDGFTVRDDLVSINMNQVIPYVQSNELVVSRQSISPRTKLLCIFLSIVFLFIFIALLLPFLNRF